tara:strand:- start:131 stop:508 length:378 start_codon:yes stop_codon:yes gene_type:complete
MAGKRVSKESNEVIDEMFEFLNSENKISDDISNLLSSLKSQENSLEIKEVSSTQDIASNEKESLFDIKKLNDIEDRMIRGSLKKVYMSGKRNNLSSQEIIDDMIKQLTDMDKINDDLLEFLKGLL